jgi:hypothetical protein
MSCSNCGHNPIHARNRCHRCHAYLLRYGAERPPYLIEREDAKLHAEGACLNCSSPNIHARQRCRLCYRFFMRHGLERPQKPGKGDLEHPRLCACGRAHVSKIISSQILTADDYPLTIAIPVCDLCYQLEHDL